MIRRLRGDSKLRLAGAAIGLGVAAGAVPLLASAAPLDRSALLSRPPLLGVLPFLSSAPPSRAVDVRLSDEHTLSRWAHAVRAVPVRRAPNASAARTGRLHLLTENSFREVYLLLREHRAADGTIWVRLRIPGRPLGQTGWVRRHALGPYRVVRTLLRIDRAALRLTLYRSGKAVFTAPAAIGGEATPTPAGRYWIREKLRTPQWPWYGPAALGTSAYTPGLAGWPNGGVIGVHGTNRPDLIPGRPSHGCIRLHNRDIEMLFRQVPRGTPVRIV